MLVPPTPPPPNLFVFSTHMEITVSGIPSGDHKNCEYESLRDGSHASFESLGKINAI